MIKISIPIRVSILVISIVFIFQACSSEPPPIPITESKTLNRLIKKGQNSVVSFKQISPDTLYAHQDQMLGKSRVDSLPFSARLGRIAGLVKMGDSLYVADGKQNCIWVIDQQGNICRQIGRAGRGPGEFGQLSGLIRNDNSIYTTDISNARVQMFNSNFELQNIFNHTIYGTGLPGSQRISVTDSLLYLAANSHTAGNLITAHQAVAPFDSLASFLPRLIPRGMQPGAYNGYSIGTNSEGNAAVTYTGLPYIFLYNSSQQLQHVVYVDFSDDRLPDNPPVRPVDKEAHTASGAIGVQGLIGKPFLADSGSLYFSIGGRLYHLKYHPDENKYQAKWIKYFTYADPKKRIESSNGITISNFLIDENENKFYFGSIFKEYIYRLSLN